MNLHDLSTLALSRTPQPTFNGATALERMLDGFEQTRLAFLPLVPKGTTLDYKTAVDTMLRLQSELDQKADYLYLQLQTGSDLAEAFAVALGAEQSRQFFVAQYVMAIQGIGAYASGAAALEVQRGALSPQDFDNGVSMRTRVFATLVSSAKSGSLAALLQGESVASRVIKTQGMPPTSTTSLVISSQGTGFQSSALSLAGPVPVPPIFTPPVVVAIIVIVAIALIAAVTLGVIQWYDLKRNADIMEDICQRAMREGNPKATEICRQFADKSGKKGLLEQMLGESGTKELGKWLMIGVFVAAGIYFLPAITRSFKQSHRELKA
jgi:hypothetical protein